MTKHLENILNIDHIPDDSEDIQPEPIVMAPQIQQINIQDKLAECDKIAEALPKVKGLGDISDQEFDSLASKAEQAYDDLMDLGMNVEARYGSKMFEVAATMLNAAITAKNAKIDKKLKMIELQLKKLAIEKKHADPEESNKSATAGEGYIISDRNSMLEKLKNLK